VKVSFEDTISKGGRDVCRMRIAMESALLDSTVECASRFDALLAEIPNPARRQTIRDALNRSEFMDEADLKSVVAGIQATGSNIIRYFQEELRLSKSDASVLAGRVFQPQVQAPPAPG
jgi:hypothetical protein